MSIILASLEKHVMFKFNYLFSFFWEGGGNVLEVEVKSREGGGWGWGMLV